MLRLEDTASVGAADAEERLQFDESHLDSQSQPQERLNIPPAPVISGWTTHAKLMQTNEGEVQFRSSGTPLACFWDSKKRSSHT